MPDPLKATARTTVARGAILTVSMRWIDRLLGLVSTMILARLLVVEDFGLVAMAMVIVGLLDVLLDLGVGSALIQNRGADAEDFNTAWTLRLIQSITAAALLVVSAPFVAAYYSDARVEAILKVIAVTALVGGLENIGTVSFQRNMEFGRDLQFFLLKRIIGFVFGIAAALMLRSYWALVLGSLITRLAGVCISYWMSAFRPKASLARFEQIWSFSKWNLLASVGGYLNGGLGRFVIGKRENAATLGAFSVGEEIAMMPTSELLAPLGRVMFPVFAEARHDPPKMLHVLTLALAVQSLIAMPAGIGLALVADDAIPILLGLNWTSAVPFVQIIGLASIATALSHSGLYMLAALGRMKTVAAIAWARVVMLLLLVVVVFPDAGARGVAWSVLATAYAGLVILHILARHVVAGFGGRDTLRHIWRPLLATGIMAASVLAVSKLLDGAPALPRLILQIGTGACSYTLIVFALWRFAGSPDGAERYLLDKLGAGLRRSPPAETNRQIRD